jgi:hypothetical protein
VTAASTNIMTAKKPVKLVSYAYAVGEEAVFVGTESLGHNVGQVVVH